MPKELAFFRYNGRDKAPSFYVECGNHLFKSDCLLTSLEPVYRLNSAWIKANVHGLDFHGGVLNQSMFRKILRNITIDCKYIFTKGETMRLFLESQLSNFGVVVLNVEVVYPTWLKLPDNMRQPDFQCMYMHEGPSVACALTASRYYGQKIFETRAYVFPSPASVGQGGGQHEKAQSSAAICRPETDQNHCGMLP